MAPKLDHSGSFVGPTDGDHDNAVMISEMDSPGLNPLPQNAMTSLLKQIEKEEEDVGYSKKATLGLPILSINPAISASEVINPNANNNQETQLLLPVPSLRT